MKKQVLAFSASLLLFSSCVKEMNPNEDGVEEQSAASAQLGNSMEGEEDNFVPNELLVKFKDGISPATRADLLALIQGNVKEQIVTKAMQSIGDNQGFFMVKTSFDVATAVSKMKALAEVLYAEPNYIYKHGATSTDTYYSNGSLWGMYGASTSPSNQYGSNAAAAWAAGRTGSSSVIVGVIDEGVQNDHPDLAGQVVNPNETINGVDDDGNGHVDDRYGWDFVNNDNSVYDGNGSGSTDAHGTHVAGTIGAKSNGLGVVGVNWNVKIISAKFLGPDGGTLDDAVKAVDYFTDLKRGGLSNLVALNNSWGGGGYSQALADAIERANQQNIVFVAAAGNGNIFGVGQNNDSRPTYPASYTNANVIAVASITSTGAISSFSNYGKASVDLGAPGSGINSSVPGGYANYSGTSMATPHVTGACALYASVKPGSSAATIKNAILNSAVATSSLRRKCVTGGRLDANAALSR
jgi:subtilisin family serine protease